MENSINLSILIPIIPFVVTVFITALLSLFNRTINRLTKPISLLLLISFIFSILLSAYFLINHIEGQIYLSNYLPIFENSKLQIHINEITEKFIVVLELISSILIIYSLVKLPRQKGYVLYLVNIGFFTSLIISALLLYDINLIN